MIYLNDLHRLQKNNIWKLLFWAYFLVIFNGDLKNIIAFAFYHVKSLLQGIACFAEKKISAFHYTFLIHKSIQIILYPSSNSH